MLIPYLHSFFCCLLFEADLFETEDSRGRARRDPPPWVTFKTDSQAEKKVKLHNPHGRSEAHGLYPALIDGFVKSFLERIGATLDTVVERERGASRSPTNKSPRAGASGPKSGANGSSADKGESNSDEES